MKLNKRISLLMAGAVLGAILFASTTTAERPAAQTPLEAAAGYYDAYMDRDAAGMMFYSEDTNYLDEKSRKEGYLKDFITNPTTDYQIVGSKKMNNYEFQFYIVQEYAGQNYDQSPPLPHKVFKTENGWKVLVEPLEINTVTGEVTKGTPIHALKHTEE
ncbi:hypothetical protein [Paenibacillus sp. FSL R7-0652]|uniref:DUF4878 domain-containing protein n=1 Tax=Paenibacillus sp. AN1007 TaxID=3151385 RepID=A0AAU8NED9_9BACL